MRDRFDRIGLPMREIVHGVNAPRITGAMVRRVQDAIQHRVAHVEVRRGHVDLGPQRARSVGKLAGPHAAEQVEVLGRRPVAVRAVLARRGQRAAIFAHLVAVQVADVGLAGLDQLLGPIVELAEIIRGVEHPLFPIEAEPADAVLDRVDVFHVLFAGIGIVEAQVALAAVVLGQAEVQADALGMPNVQVAVRLGRKARMDAAGVFAGAEVVFDDLLDEIQPALGLAARTAGIIGRRSLVGVLWFVVHATIIQKCAAERQGSCWAGPTR